MIAALTRGLPADSLPVMVGMPILCIAIQGATSQR